MAVSLRACRVGSRVEGLVDGAEGVERGFELGLTVGVEVRRSTDRARRWRRRRPASARSPAGERADAAARPTRPAARATAWSGCGERARPGGRARRPATWAHSPRAGGAAAEHDLVDRLPGERLDEGQQPAQVVGGALDRGPHEVDAPGVEREVEEAAAHRAVGVGRERAGEPREEEHPAGARLGGRRARRRARRRGRRSAWSPSASVAWTSSPEHVLDRLAGHAVLGPHEVVAGQRARHREDLVVEVDRHVVDRVEQHAVVPMRGRRARPRTRRWRTRRRGCRSCPAAHDHAGREPELRRPSPGAASPTTASTVRRAAGGGRRRRRTCATRLGVVLGHAERAVVAQLAREHRATGWRRSVPVRRRVTKSITSSYAAVGVVDVGPVVLEVEHVAERQARCRSAGCRGARSRS